MVERKLGLKVNAEKTKVTPPSKLKYLGFGFWKQWKTISKREWGLLKLGVLKWIAHKTANGGDHYQFVATKPVLARAVSKEILTKRGLISISDYYAKVHI